MPSRSSGRGSAGSTISTAHWSERSTTSSIRPNHFKHSSHGVKDWYRNNKPLNETGFDNTLFGNEAVRVVERHEGKSPLFLYLAFTAPHTPFQAPQEYLDRFKDIADDNRRKYAAMISVMDDGVGKVVAALEKKGMRDNTIIIFHSDNGGVKNSLFAGETGGRPNCPTSPLMPAAHRYVPAVKDQYGWAAGAVSSTICAFGLGRSAAKTRPEPSRTKPTSSKFRSKRITTPLLSSLSQY